MKSPPDAQVLHPAFGGLSSCAQPCLSPTSTPFPIEATGGGPSAMQPNSLSDAHYQTAPSKCSAQTLHRQTGTCLLKHEFVAYQTGACLLKHKYDTYQTGTCLLNHKFDAYQTGACLLNHNFEAYQTGACLLNHNFDAYQTGACLLNYKYKAYQTGTLNVQRTLRETDLPPERPQNPRRKAKPRAAICPCTRRLTLLPFLCRAFPHPQQVLPTNKRMGQQHETE